MSPTLTLNNVRSKNGNKKTENIKEEVIDIEDSVTVEESVEVTELCQSVEGVHIHSQGSHHRVRGTKKYKPRGNRRGGEGSQSTEIVPKTVPMKNAVMMLNEMFPPPAAAQYRVTSMVGAPNNPTFSVVCSILGEEFSGSGRSKKEAKLAASQLALTQMYGKDFSQSSAVTTNTSSPRAVADCEGWLELEGKNPVSVLNELHPGATFQLVSASGPSHSPQYCIEVTLGSLQFQGWANSKREAKLAACKALLVHIHQVGFDPMTGNLQQGTRTNREEDHCWADTVARMVRDQFDFLLGGSTYSKRKVLAGVVLDFGGELSVVCVSTGTKCVNGEQLCLEGSVLNDCHAEVIARRCVMAWLYQQLTLALQEEKSVLIKSDLGGFSLHPSASLHMFISTAPCGDARIFSLHEKEVTGWRSQAGMFSNRGKLRSKIESGMGTVPLPSGGKQQTWDGVLSGDRLLTMACSDKLLRWNVVGVQGALLTHWLEPIYFSSLTLGSKYQPIHVKRALYDRLGVGLVLPRPYKVGQPALLSTTSPESRQPTKAQEFSANWFASSSGPELVVGSTGRTTAGEPSRLCKHSMATNFLAVARIPGAREAARTAFMNSKLTVEGHHCYRHLKVEAEDFNLARKRLVHRLVEQGAGEWVRKPEEQDMFYV